VICSGLEKLWHWFQRKLRGDAATPALLTISQEAHQAALVEAAVLKTRLAMAQDQIDRLRNEVAEEKKKSGQMSQDMTELHKESERRGYEFRDKNDEEEKVLRKELQEKEDKLRKEYDEKLEKEKKLEEEIVRRCLVSVSRLEESITQYRRIYA
jgi:hypothetical protein